MEKVASIHRILSLSFNHFLEYFSLNSFYRIAFSSAMMWNSQNRFFSLSKREIDSNPNSKSSLKLIQGFIQFSLIFKRISHRWNGIAMIAEKLIEFFCYSVDSFLNNNRLRILFGWKKWKHVRAFTLQSIEQYPVHKKSQKDTLTIIISEHCDERERFATQQNNTVWTVDKPKIRS